MHTWWTMVGTTTTYTGTVVNTDGYKITASFLWRSLTTETTTTANPTDTIATTN